MYVAIIFLVRSIMSFPCKELAIKNGSYIDRDFSMTDVCLMFLLEEFKCYIIPICSFFYWFEWFYNELEVRMALFS